jgi:hypothetical protein
VQRVVGKSIGESQKKYSKASKGRNTSDTSNRLSNIAVQDLPKLQHNIFKFNPWTSEDFDDSAHLEVDNNSQIVGTELQVSHRLKGKSPRQIGGSSITEQRLQEPTSLMK